MFGRTIHRQGLRGRQGFHSRGISGLIVGVVIFPLLLFQLPLILCVTAGIWLIEVIKHTSWSLEVLTTLWTRGGKWHFQQCITSVTTCLFSPPDLHVKGRYLHQSVSNCLWNFQWHRSPLFITNTINPGLNWKYFSFQRYRSQNGFWRLVHGPDLLPFIQIVTIPRVHLLVMCGKRYVAIISSHNIFLIVIFFTQN